MSWTLYCARLENADFAGAPVAFQPFTLPRRTRLKAIRTWFVMYNNPVFTALGMQIWSDVNGAPGQLVHTFTKTYALADLLETEAYAAKEIYFDFAEAKFMRKDVQYHLVPTVSGAAFDENSHLAWVYGFPDPNTSTDGLTIDLATIPSTPFYLSLFGDDR